MTATELIEIINGRSLATLHAVAYQIAKKDCAPAELIFLMKGSLRRVESECDGTPEGKAHVKGYSSALAIIQEALASANDADLLLALDTQTSN